MSVHPHRLLRARSAAETLRWSAGAAVMLAALLVPVAAYAQGPAHLLKDVNANRTGSRPSNLAQVNGTLFFTNVDLNTGLTELWKSDGTEAGTVLVKRVLVSSALTKVGGKFFFRVIDPSGELQLWTSDGTAAGTVQVGNFASFFDLHDLTDVDGTLFFLASDRSGATDLWKSDGTVAGTVELMSFPSQGGGAAPLRNLTAVGAMLFFVSTPDSYETQLWRSDGTAGGTVPIKGVARAAYLAALNGTLFFGNATALWHLNATNTGAVRVKEFPSGQSPGPLNSLIDGNVTTVNGTLFLLFGNVELGFELLRSDGTEAGTVPVKTFPAGVEGPFGEHLNALTPAATTLFFLIDPGDGTGRQALWRSDGTAAGTVRVKDFPASCPSSGSVPLNLTAVKETLFFAFDQDCCGLTQWISDGTEADTVPVTSSYLGAGRTVVFEPTDVNGTLFFAEPGELWKSDGSAGGTIRVKAFNLGTLSSDPRDLTTVGGSLFFTADNGTTGRELWKSDGTTPGTVRVAAFSGPASILGGPCQSQGGGNPTDGGSNLTDVNGTLFLTAYDESSGTGLWKSDGTTAGTVLVKGGFFPGPTNQGPSSLTNFSGTLVFIASGATTGVELWKSDGTTGGTAPIKSVPFDRSGFGPGALTKVGAWLFFENLVHLSPDQQELWRSDGTEAGTVSFEGFLPPSLAFSGTDVDGTFFFVVDVIDSSQQLWRSDGTAAGTEPVFFLGGSRSFILKQASVNGMLFFVVTDEQSGEQSGLWKSDGTPSGTSRISDLDAGGLTNVNGTLYFAASDGGAGVALWKSDGTAAGTLRVKTLNPGPPSISVSFAPGNLTDVKGTLLFSSDDGISGREPWRSDGTRRGTVRVQDIAPAMLSSNPASFTVAGSTVFFTADDGQSGTELWALPIAALAAACVGDCDGDGKVTVDELVGVVNIALGDALITACEPGDTNGDSKITVDELVTAVNNALNGCRQPPLSR